MLKKLLLTSLLFSSFVSAYALTPTLSLSNSGTGDSVLVSVKGDPNSDINLSYYSTIATGLQTQKIGRTDSGGNFWTVISTVAYNLSNSGSVYITVNGQVSSSSAWPYTSGSNNSTGTFSLNQTGLVLSPGQTSSLVATNASSMYLFNNTNPSVVNVSITGNQINVSANNYGSTVFTICSGSSSNCVSVYVTVQNGNSQLLTFSQSNITIATAQTLPITIYGGSGTYTIISNSNSGVIQASLSGTTLNITGNSGAGQSSITVCTTNMSSCGIINATIGTVNSSAISFSQTSPILTVGQTLIIQLTGSSGSYTISSNTNSSSVQASVSGSSLTLYGVSYGSANIVVCSSTGSCGSLNVTTSSAGSGGAVTLSQTSLVLIAGQTVGVTVSGGSLPYSTTYSTNGIVQSTLNNNILTLTGYSAGNTSVNICSAGGGCAALSVTVNSSNGSISATPGFSQSSVSLTLGQNSTIGIIGSGGYYLAGNTNTSIATAVISGSNVVITGNANGNTVFTICQSTSQCNTINVTVGGSVVTSSVPLISPIIQVNQSLNFNLSPLSNSYYISSSPSAYFTASVSGNTLSITGVTNGSGQITICSSSSNCSTFSVNVINSTAVNQPTIIVNKPVTNAKYIFNNPLNYGSVGSEVIELQKRLHEEGYYNGSYVANYGNATLSAVKKYQKAHGLSQLGNLGPATRSFLNK